MPPSTHRRSISSTANRRTILAAVVLAASCSLACDDPGPRFDHWSELRIWTERLHYSRSIDTVIQVSLTNGCEHPLYYFAPTDWITVEIRRDTGWENLGAWYALLAVVPRLEVIDSGGTLQAIPLRLGQLQENGVYRFNFVLYQEPEPDALLPLDFRVSNWFEVTN